jgi:dTDP-4-dehydrorhamnose 3,5-epimerase-like enzyme
MSIKLEVFLGTRVTKDERSSFVKLSKKLKMQQSEVLRELIVAFIQNRVTITPPTHIEGLHNHVN